jgi:hypothetical protein
MSKETCPGQYDVWSQRNARILACATLGIPPALYAALLIARPASPNTLKPLYSVKLQLVVSIIRYFTDALGTYADMSRFSEKRKCMGMPCFLQSHLAGYLTMLGNATAVTTLLRIMWDEGMVNQDRETLFWIWDIRFVALLFGIVYVFLLFAWYSGPYNTKDHPEDIHIKPPAFWMSPKTRGAIATIVGLCDAIMIGIALLENNIDNGKWMSDPTQFGAMLKNFLTHDPHTHVSGIVSVFESIFRFTSKTAAYAYSRRNAMNIGTAIVSIVVPVYGGYSNMFSQFTETPEDYDLPECY